MHRKYFVPLLSLSYFLIVSACHKNQPQQINEVSANIPVSGDIYVAASIGDATYLNPILASDSASGEINGLVYNGLVKYDKNIKLIGDLAEKWTISKDGLKLTFYLRKNIKWHDGKPFSAEDVKFTYGKLIDPRVKTPYAADYLLVKKFEILNPYTIRITYKEPLATSLESWAMGIIPKHIFENGDFNSNLSNRKPVGTGPYIFKEWITDEKIVLEANPNYFEGRPYISRYIYRIVPDQSVQFLELRNQSIDEMGLTPDQWKAYPEFFKHYNKFRYPSFSFVYLGLNLRLPLFKDKLFREAIAYGIDKNEIINGVLLSMGKSATGPFPPQSWAYNSNVKDYEYNPKKALKILNKLGWRDSNGDGYLEKNGETLGFTIITNQGNKMRSLTAEIIQSQLKKIGIKVNVRIIEWSALVHQFIDKKKFEALIMGWSLSRDPDEFPLWHSSQIKEGQYNFISYSNPEVDRLLLQGRRTLDRKKRTEIYNKLHSVMAKDLPVIFLYYPEALPVIHKRFKGVEVAPLGIGWNFIKWWVPKSQQRYKQDS
ncbi:MAG: peptide-binding protein [Elusimicrobia bacterium]|nr:peptide-binding protein [Elusimicrobiota bacterium]